MKKTLLSLFSIIITGFLFAQDCEEIFFSEVIEGSGNNKCVEIYNPTNETIDLADYLVKRYSNGNTVAEGGYITDIAGTIPPNGTFILVNGQTVSTDISPACDPVLQALAVSSNGMMDGEYPAPMYANGNDALTIEKENGVIVDIFGKVGEDPNSGWYDQDSTNYVAGTYWWLAWTANHTLIRKNTVLHGVTTNPGSTANPPFYFNPATEWDTLPQDTWDHLTWHECDCHESRVNESFVKKQNAYFFPNPVTDNYFTVKATEIITSVEIINLIGQSVYYMENNAIRGDMNISLDKVDNGLYIVKVNLADNQSVIKKLLIK